VLRRNVDGGCCARGIREYSASFENRREVVEMGDVVDPLRFEVDLWGFAGCLSRECSGASSTRTRRRGNERCLRSSFRKTSVTDAVS